ncbi:hypothetical protein K440DRAFT_121593 [Wilcoxina mikolae CBS 423.85]|nr:hypothetical protein K440DRAFT_121593 [Wilcoxina mikolae CBS 423.85]
MMDDLFFSSALVTDASASVSRRTKIPSSRFITPVPQPFSLSSLLRTDGHGNMDTCSSGFSEDVGTPWGLATARLVTLGTSILLVGWLLVGWLVGIRC